MLLLFIADLIACSTCFGHHYAHHQELKSIIQWLLPVGFRAVVMCPVCRMLQHPANRTHNHSTKYHRQQPLYNTLELLMMGIVVPETCWASNKICNKNLCCIKLAFYVHIMTEGFQRRENLYSDFPEYGTVYTRRRSAPLWRNMLLRFQRKNKGTWYTGCFTTLGHNCTRWFPRSLRWKKFI